MQPRKHFTPRAYGHLISNFILEHDRCAIWAGMGLGKTVSTLNAIEALLMVEDDPVLVVAPLRVARTTWPDEARKWEHLRGICVMPIVGSETERLLALRQPAQVYTVNYENLPWLVERWGDRWPYRTVILDEATKVKGFRVRQGTLRAKALARVAHTKVRRLVQLTGTPSPNGLADLWGQAWFLDRGQRLGRTYSAFTQRWFQASHDGYGSTPLKHAQKEIQDLLRDVCLTVDAKDWFDLREPIVNNIYVDLPIQARKHYREMEKAMFTEIDAHQVEAFNAAARTIKCLQIANGAAYVGETGSADWKPLHDAKLQALESVIEEAAGAPVLVAYHFKSDLARLQQAYPDGLLLSTTEGLRAAQAGKGRVWFGHPASMGHGVDGLQEHCNILAWFGHWWNLEERMQMLERIGPTRQMQAGHDRPVFVHNILARDTVDELVLARIETKREVQDLLLEAMKTRRTAA